MREFRRLKEDLMVGFEMRPEKVGGRVGTGKGEASVVLPEVRIMRLPLRRVRDG